MNSKTAVGALGPISWLFTCRVKRFISINYLLLTFLLLTCQVVRGETVRGFTEESSKKGFYPVWQNGDPLPKINLVDKRTGSSTIQKSAVVLIHGWNPDGVQNALAYSAGWQYFSNELEKQLDSYDPNKKWSIVNFNWSRAASTGQWSPSFYAPVTAATNADRIGYDYARALQSANPDLRQVQFIAHSAGSWLARSAIQELTAFNPLVVCQLTLLDPYVPLKDVVSDTIVSNTSLSVSAMEAITLNERVWSAQNFYSGSVNLCL